MKIEIRPAKIRDIKAMKGKLRREDCLEIYRLFGCKPYIALLRSYQRSRKNGKAYVGLINNEIACAWGVVKDSILSKVVRNPASSTSEEKESHNCQRRLSAARIWLLSTDTMNKAPVKVAIRTKRELDKLMQEYPYLENDVDAKYTKCLQWLHWLGFIIEEPRQLGIHNELFCHFYKESN